MRYVTHQFAHSETLERAHRWLIHAGIAPDRMQVRRQGVPLLAVSAEPGEVNSIEMVISTRRWRTLMVCPASGMSPASSRSIRTSTDTTNPLADPSTPARSYSPGSPLMRPFRRTDQAATRTSRVKLKI